MKAHKSREQAIDFTHPALNEPVHAIGGQYLFESEKQMEAGGGKVLYFTGYFIMDRSCCGTGGCAYALVAGFVKNWKYAETSAGIPISRVLPVTDEKTRNRIAAIIRDSDPLIRVSFMPAVSLQDF